MSLPCLYLARHGETEWTITGQHTGLTDIPLTARGKENAKRLGERLQSHKFVRVFTSPLIRARQTCDLAGYGTTAEVDRDLVEWNYGDFEGLKTAEILAKQPGWQLFRDGCPGGESPADVMARVDRVITRIRGIDGDVLLFSSGHLLRTLGSRWLGLEPTFGRYLVLTTATLSILGYEHNRSEPAIRLWNDSQHVIS